jgi:hypothetical protein
MMESKPLKKPVAVELGHVGRFRHIRNAREAAECLTTVRPLNRGPRHSYAVETRLKVLEGNRAAADARRAGVEAARESDVLAGNDSLH